MGQGHRGRGGMDRGHGGRQCEVLEWMMGVDIGCGDVNRRMYHNY